MQKGHHAPTAKHWQTTITAINPLVWVCNGGSAPCIVTEADSQFTVEESSVVCGRLLFPRTARKRLREGRTPMPQYMQKPDRGSSRLTFRAGWAHCPSAITHFLSALARMHARGQTHTYTFTHASYFAPQPLCPANTAELSTVTVATRQQGCSVLARIRTALCLPLPR